MKAWKKILLGSVVVLVVLIFAKDILLKTVITTVGSSVLGAPLKMDGFSLGVLSQKMRIKNLRLYNPPGFPDEPMIDIPEISIDASIPALLTGKIHVPYIVVDLKRMTVVKNSEGKTNVDALKVVQEQKDGVLKREDKKPTRPKETKPSQNMPFVIDYMRLNIGEVVIKDYQKSDPPTVTVQQIGVNNKEFKNITSVAQMATLIMVECIGPTGLRSVGLHAASSALGVAFLPAGIAGILTGSDSTVAEYDSKVNKVYDELMKIIEQNNGKLKSQDPENGIIKAVFQGADVAIKVEKVSTKTKVTVSARKMLIPKPEIAGGVLHRLSEVVK